MRKLLNTLYVTTENAYLSKDGQNVVVSIEQQEKLRIPIINLEGIVTFGYTGASPGLMKLCADNGVSLSFISHSGRFIGRFQGPVKGNVLLRKRQYELTDSPEFQLKISRLFIAGKIQNSRSILMRYMRDYSSNDELDRASQTLQWRKNQVLQAQSLEILRGIEGDAANTYFNVFSHMIRQQKDCFNFNGRTRRPPKDAVNTMLSFAYTLLAHDMASALESVGLDPYVGFIHTMRPGRISLALDIMEELRAYLCDRLVLTLINREQIQLNDFINQGEDGFSMTENGRKIFLSAWQSRKKETIIHPYLQEKIQIGLIPFIQAQLLARMIRGDIDNYPVFIFK